MYHYAWTRPEFAAKIDSRRLITGRLTDLLREAGAIAAVIRENLSAVAATATEAHELDIATGSPLLRLEERRYDAEEYLFTLARFLIVPSFLQLEFEHTPGPADGG
jgi:DNA-binding GntR family transcriptional regulator